MLLRSDLRYVSYMEVMLLGKDGNVEAYLGKLKPLEKAKKGDVSWKASAAVAQRLLLRMDRVSILPDVILLRRWRRRSTLAEVVIDSGGGS